jgi:hypothetical protein
MRFNARTIAVYPLTALLAVSTCCEHALHCVTHIHSVSHAHSVCHIHSQHREAPTACHTHDGCTNDEPSHATTGTPATNQSDSQNPIAPEHDSQSCAVCRFMALPQLIEPPREFLLDTDLVADVNEPPESSIDGHSIHHVLIRGPPRQWYQLSS